MNLNDLKKPFDPKLISWRVGATTKDKKKAIPLAYINARDVMERLDKVCGTENWQVRYSHADRKTIAEVGIKINNEWVWKANGAGDTDIEADKGAISDAFKRAAVLWGVGRYLYDVQNIWVEIDEYRKIKNPNDSRLIGALEKAAAGIRQPSKTEKLSDLEDEIAEAKRLEVWLDKALPVLDSKEDMAGFNNWMTKNQSVIDKLDNHPKLKKRYNEEAAKIMERIMDNEAINKGE